MDFFCPCAGLRRHWSVVFFGRHILMYITCTVFYICILNKICHCRRLELCWTGVLANQLHYYYYNYYYFFTSPLLLFLRFKFRFREFLKKNMSYLWHLNGLGLFWLDMLYDDLSAEESRPIWSCASVYSNAWRRWI